MTGRTAYCWGLVVLAMVGLQIAFEISGLAPFQDGAICCLVVVVFVGSRWIQGLPRLLLTVSVILSGLVPLMEQAPLEPIMAGLRNSTFLAAFFCAITAIRTAAAASPSMKAAGVYLARQSPGRRYFALTFGAQAFSHVMSFGAIQLLGALAVDNAGAELGEQARQTRIRRMLLAVHRGFVSAMPWSPSSFTVALVVAIIPGVDWLQLAIPGLGASMIILSTGWAIDRIFRPSFAAIRTVRSADPGNFRSLLPLLLLLGLMLSLLVVLGALTDMRVVGLVMIIIPTFSLCWVLIQLRGAKGLRPRLQTYLSSELPSYRKEVVMIASAGYLGVMGSTLLQPVFQSGLIDMTSIPVWVLLVALVWLVPLLGQLGASPVLAISLVGPLLPLPGSLGITPAALALPLVCGWAMSGISCPFTPTTLLIGRFGGISAIRVAWDWNRSYFFATTGLLSIWVCAFAVLTA